ncbi:MAG TPA: hypothetical protein PLE07_02720, partial [Candidatus Paceibacterota bacterium]|nr:hypothetical protein [Candidatus Paceibacterota bacterium]
DQLFKRESTTPQPKKEYGYLMNARPFSIGAQPKGQVRVNERTDGRYGTIYYDRPLTEQEMKSYELKPEGPIVYKDVTDNPFYNDIKDLKVIDTDKSADNILELTGSDKPIFLRNGKERIAVITPSAKQKGKFQATKFDERGPIGDAVSSTPKEAIKSLIEDGYKELSNEQEFTELTFDTKETQRQEVIRNINKPTTPSPEPQQATEVVAEDMKPQPIEQTPVKTPEIETMPEIGDTIQWNTPKVLGKTQTKTGTIVDKTAENRWIVSIDGQEFDFNPQKNTNIKVVEKYQQPAKTEQEQYLETRRAEIAQEQKAKEEARQAEYPDLKVEQKAEEKSSIFTDEEIAKKKTYIQRLNDEFEQKQKENKERAAKRIPVKSFEYGDKPTENKYYRILMANENIDAKEGFEIVEDAKPFKVKDVEGDYFIVKEQNTDYKKRSIHARFPKSKMLYSVSDA